MDDLHVEETIDPRHHERLMRFLKLVQDLLDTCLRLFETPERLMRGLFAAMRRGNVFSGSRTE